MHWGTFILTDEPMKEPKELLQKMIKEMKMPDSEFSVMNHGETRKI